MLSKENNELEKWPKAKNKYLIMGTWKISISYSLLYKISEDAKVKYCLTKFSLQHAAQRWRLKNIASCRGGVTRSQFFLQLATRLSLAAIWKSARAKDVPLAHFNKIALQVAIDMSHAATCLATLRKVEDSSTFLATRNATFLLCCSCKNGVLHEVTFRATCSATKLRGKLQEKLPCVTWP